MLAAPVGGLGTWPVIVGLWGIAPAVATAGWLRARNVEPAVSAGGLVWHLTAFLFRVYARRTSRMPWVVRICPFGLAGSGGTRRGGLGWLR